MKFSPRLFLLQFFKVDVYKYFFNEIFITQISESQTSDNILFYVNIWSIRIRALKLFDQVYKK
jgi:hypothetical protein